MKKTIRITNKYRFITFVTLFVLVVSMAIGACFPVSAAGADQSSYTEVKVKAGDTLWKLAKTYGDQNKDVREVIYDICRINNVDAGSIYPGQILVIPER